LACNARDAAGVTGGCGGLRMTGRKDLHPWILHLAVDGDLHQNLGVLQEDLLQ